MHATNYIYIIWHVLAKLGKLPFILSTWLCLRHHHLCIFMPFSLLPRKLCMLFAWPKCLHNIIANYKEFRKPLCFCWASRCVSVEQAVVFLLSKPLCFCWASRCVSMPQSSGCVIPKRSDLWPCITWQIPCQLRYDMWGQVTEVSKSAEGNVTCTVWWLVTDIKGGPYVIPNR